MVVSEDDLQSDAELMQVADTANSLRSGFGHGKRGQQQRDQNADYGDDRQHFNQCERILFEPLHAVWTFVLPDCYEQSRSLVKPAQRPQQSHAGMAKSIGIDGTANADGGSPLSHAGL